MISAIIITERVEAGEERQTRSRVGTWRKPWACVDMLGQSAVARFAEYLRREGCDSVSVVGNDLALSRRSKAPTDHWVNAELLLANHQQEGFETILVARCGAYVEFDLAEMLRFHNEHGEATTRGEAADGPLDLWMVNSSSFSSREGIVSALRAANSVPYQLAGYVNRLQTAGDFRRLVLDSFSSRCGMRPEGSETRPGVWICEGAQIERSARIVAPAFIGRDVKIADECLITRGSNIESNSQIDFGTAIEDSSILSDSYVGIGLDLSHSVVDGSSLLNLQHNVTLEITDPVVMRQKPVRGGSRQSWAGVERVALSSTE